MRRGRVALSSLSFTVSLAAQRGLPFLALPIASRTLSAEEFGSATLSITICALVATLLSFGLGGALPKIYNSPFDPRSNRAVWVTLLLLQLAVCCFAAVIAVAVIMLSGPGTIVPLLIAATVLAIATSVQLSLQGLTVARSAGIQLAIATVVQLSLGLALVLTLTPLWGAAGYVSPEAQASGDEEQPPAVTLVLRLLAVSPWRRPSWSFAAITAGLKLAVPFSGQGISNWVVGQMDRVVVSVFLGAASLGSYQVAYMLGSVLGMILEGMQAGWAGRYYRAQRADKEKDLYGLGRSTILLAIAGAIFVCGLSSPFASIVAPDYPVDPVVTAIVAVSAVPRALYFNAIVALLDHGRSASIFASTLLSGAVTIVGLLVFVPLIGQIGAAAVTFLAFVVQATVVLKLAFRRGILTILVRSALLPTVVLLPGILVTAISFGNPLAGAAIALGAAVFGLFAFRRLFHAISRMTA